MSLIKLDSVGCVIDEKGVTYPMLVDGGYDEDGGRHVNDIENEEFFKALIVTGKQSNKQRNCRNNNCIC